MAHRSNGSDDECNARPEFLYKYYLLASYLYHLQSTHYSFRNRLREILCSKCELLCVPSVSRVFEIFFFVASLCPLLMLLMSQSWSFYLIFIITLHMLMLLARVCVYLSLVVRCTDSTRGKTGRVHMCTCTLFCIWFI